MVSYRERPLEQSRVVTSSRTSQSYLDAFQELYESFWDLGALCFGPFGNVIRIYDMNDL